MINERYSPFHIIVYGGGGHAKSVIDMIRALGGYTIAGIIDDGIPAGSSIMGVTVLGGQSKLDELHDLGLQLAVNSVGGIGNPDSRVKVFERLDQAGYVFPTFIHPRAFVEPTAKMAEGTQVLALAYIGSESSIGFGCVINYGAIVSHDCQLADYVNLSPGSVLAGGVKIGERSQVGMNATINLDINVGHDVRIGNGATVKKDVGDRSIIHAGEIFPAPKIK